ncbi:uncharacterized protein BX664DRAFT_327820 [Halteromyces radiatus]|uniref:uncharacterized protein n=1 Tax=Halteromyces radiatus TaxID=101107 RepID=UPI00221EBE2A|nr:uncharacterized protein BX664DRAFT_327820 [Halteromyces radiatus]KAI8092654.1 hypothetical protein BX664DRAFT_327820 [Halteromyces radiatus]
MASTSGQSIRLRVNLPANAPIVFSYPDLLKRHEKEVKDFPLAPLIQDDNDFYKLLLERAAKYDMKPDEEDVESGEEDNTPNKDNKGDEYDYDDPFIDDSDMMLDEPYEYSQPEYDGFFVYHGSLDGSDNTTGSKKKTNVKKDTKSVGSATWNSSKVRPSTSSSTKKSTNKIETIEISDTEDDTEKPAKSTTSLTSETGTTTAKTTNSSSATNSTKTKKPSSSSSSSLKSDTTNKGSPVMKKSTSTDSTSKKPSNKPKSSLPSKVTTNDTSSTNNIVSSTDVKKSTTNTSSSTSQSSKAKSTSKKTKSSSSDKLQPLDPSIEVLMDKLRQDRAKETFEVKSKFPTSLRPTVLQVGAKMFRLYHKMDENVVNHLMDILPYNRFTLKKFLTTKAGPGIVNELQQEIEDLIKQLAEAVDKLMPEQLQQYEQKVLEQKNQPSDGLEVERKFRCNETIRRTLYEILTKDMYSVNLSNDIAEFTGRPEQVVTETKARKAMYTKLLPCWPPQWMTTYDISRQYSTYKSKMKNVDETSIKSGHTSSSHSSSSTATTTASTSAGASTTAGMKRPATTPVKRSAPSTTTASTGSIPSSPISAHKSTKQSSTQSTGGGEKRKKLSNEESSTTSADMISANKTNKKGNPRKRNYHLSEKWGKKRFAYTYFFFS